jgi:hypothetical protein
MTLGLVTSAALLSGAAGAAVVATGAAGPAGTLAAANPNATAIEYGHGPGICYPTAVEYCPNG